MSKRGVLRYFLYIVLFCAFLSFNVQAQSRLELKNKPIGNDLLATVLNLSEMKELSPKRPADSNFFLRLYSLDDISNAAADSEDVDDSSEYCAPDVETEVVCGYRYFLAVHNGDLGFAGVVYDLGLVGEIAKIELLKKTGPDVDRLQLEVTNYPAHAFKLNPKLTKKTKKYEINVGIDSLGIKELK